MIVVKAINMHEHIFMPINVASMKIAGKQNLWKPWNNNFQEANVIPVMKTPILKQRFLKWASIVGLNDFW